MSINIIKKLLSPILNNNNMDIIYESMEQKIKRLKKYFNLSHGKGKNKKRRV